MSGAPSALHGDLFGALHAAIPEPGKKLVEPADGDAVSYGEMFALARRLDALLRRCGVQPGDRVAVQVEKPWQVLALFLATLRAGAVYLPLNPGYTAAELAYFLGDAEARLFVCPPDRHAALADVARAAGVAAVLTLGQDGGGTLLAAAPPAADGPAPVPRASGDLAAILYTSGTTGRAKGAMLTHGNLLSNARTLACAWRFTSADVLVHALPIFHTHGLFVAVGTVMLSGASLLWRTRFDADEVLALLPRATVLMGVPTFYTRLVAHPGLGPVATRTMRLLVSGSAPLLAETHAAFHARTGHHILERYGMTETGMNTANPYDGPRRAGTVGPALPGIEVRIAEPASGAPLPQGAIGVIEVRGPNVFAGYWRMPEKTREAFRADGFFVTGDLGRIDADGYVTIVGRAKDLVISGGYNVYPKEVESALDALPGIVESAVIGVPHPDLGEGVTAVVVAAPGAALDTAAVLAALAQRLARYKLPKRLVVVDELPRNAMGKVQKQALRERYAQLYTAADRR